MGCFPAEESGHGKGHLSNLFKVAELDHRHGAFFLLAALNKEKARLEAGLSVLLTAGGVIVSTLIDGRTIIVIARVGVISIVRGIAVAWAVVAIAVIAAAIVCARCYSRT